MSDKLPVPCEHCKATGLFEGSEVSGVRWKGVSLNCRRSSNSQEVRKIGNDSATPYGNPPYANLDTPSWCARPLFVIGLREKLPRRCDRQTRRSWGYFCPPGTSFSLYQEHQVYRAGLGFSGRCRPRFACLLHASRVSFISLCNNSSMSPALSNNSLLSLAGSVFHCIISAAPRHRRT